ncbi:MAG: 3-isopropylmalate dehydratase small subunit [Methanoculleus sp.]|jgi:3-isopropylmalate/(R)-2-methylmalate dehydratase small subunit|nr:3-isopropylmalate dehydratase small subunit [Methanomicrobiales archaeon]
MRVWKFGDDIDTDAIIPGRFLTIYDPAELAKHAFEGTRDEFAGDVRAGDVVVAGSNFGCGSSREHAPLALLGAGVRFIIAESFARIFYRNAINTGLLPLVCAGAGEIGDGDTITVDIDGGFIEANGKRFDVEPVPGFLKTIVEAGGLVAYARDLDEVERCNTG